jgi:hypothetical protein
VHFATCAAEEAEFYPRSFDIITEVLHSASSRS